ncbi:protein SUPPRESSOR OF K(+) TRANSPORT GROWTH DEFECT 1-like [Triticum dicoccoides]|uniref:protein SUPPRESSOR OF K(+) TRANSPORT GROWTH DEFECT 1-like n=1 Tax=Triticum dicoccoides TaxID=85692 RepID=UPI00188EBCD4|nr:protein SUPPRESSOR OF K(+) TRANSPORT GROWTH DEFECT 1-like [Triticum dicoccoides]
MAARRHRHQAHGVRLPYRGDPRQAPQETMVLPVKFPRFFNELTVVKERRWRAFMLYMPTWTWTSYFAKAMTTETPFTHAGKGHVVEACRLWVPLTN